MSSTSTGPGPHPDRVSLWVAIPLAGIGGMLPTIGRLASTFVTDPTTPMPSFGMYFGLGCFFVLGAVIFLGLSKHRSLQEALVLGIAAPGIITNIAAGVADAKFSHQTWLEPFIASAYAQDASTSPPPAAQDSQWIMLPEFGTKWNEQSKTLDINTKATGDFTKWSKSPNVQIQVFAKDSATGNIVPGASFALAPNSQASIPLDLGLSQGTEPQYVVLTAGSVSKRFDFPANTKKMNVQADIQFAPENDFLWALGLNRTNRVVGMSVSSGPQVQ
jgi:hypothetical protein